MDAFLEMRSYFLTILPDFQHISGPKVQLEQFAFEPSTLKRLKIFVLFPNF